MTEIEKITLTSALTLIGGIIVFVMGQSVVRFGIEPFQEFRKLKGEIAHLLVFYAKIYSSPNVGSESERSEAVRALREKASELLARVNSIPFYGILSLLGLVPGWRDVSIAYKNLTHLGETVTSNKCEEHTSLRKNIIEALRLKMVD